MPTSMGPVLSPSRSGRADRVSATRIYLDRRTLDGAADSLLSRRGTVAVALTDGAARVPLPDDELFAQVATLPGHRESFVDFVVPADRMVAVSIWERARAIGMAQGSLRLASDPSRPATLTIVDATQRFGVWLNLLTPDDQPAPTANRSNPDPSALIAPRPRTATVYKDICGVITRVDDRVERMLGWDSTDMLGHRSLEFIHPEDHERALARWLEMRSTGRSTRVRLRHRHRDGSWLWIEMANSVAELDGPNRLVVASEMSDISDEMAAHEAVRHREKLFRRLAESLPEGLFLVGIDHRIVYANDRLGSILGVRDAATLTEQLATVAPEDRSRMLTALAAVTDDRTARQVEIEVVDPGTGSLRWCLTTITALTDEDGLPGAMVTLSDVTESARLREELRHRATHDSLTGFLNRAATFGALQHVLDANQKPPAAVLFIDLDHFKSVNDTFGHSAGDDLLADTAQRIATHVRAADVVGRIGGDEFLMICQGLDGPVEALAEAQRVQRALTQCVRVADRSIQMSASIGVTFATPGASVQSVVIRADEAMYRCKRQPDRTPVFLTTATDPPLRDS